MSDPVDTGRRRDTRARH